MNFLRDSLLAVVALTFAITTNAQTITKGAQLDYTQVKPGQIVALGNGTANVAKDNNRQKLENVFLTSTRSEQKLRTYYTLGVHTISSSGLSLNNLFRVVEAPAQKNLEGDEVPSIYLQHVPTGQYVQSYMIPSEYLGPSQLVASINDATSFELEPASNYPGCGEFKDATSAKNDKSLCLAHYEDFYGKYTRMHFGPFWNYSYTYYGTALDIIPWNVYSLTAISELSVLIELYSAQNFTVGTAVGEYPENVYKNFTLQLAAARNTVKSNSSESICRKRIAMLTEAYETLLASENKLKGYYYIVNDNSAYTTSHGSPVAMRAGEDNMLYWEDFDEENPDFIFDLKPVDDTNFYVESLTLGTYLKNDEGNTHQYVGLSDEAEVAQQITPYANSNTRFRISHPKTDRFYAMTTISGNRTRGHISHSSVSNDYAIWSLRAVPANVISRLEPIIARRRLEQQTKQVLAKAQNVVEVSKVGTPNLDDGIIKRFTTDPNTSQVSSQYTGGGNIANLGDGKIDTYFQGSIIASSPSDYCNLVVDLSDSPVSQFIAKIQRSSSASGSNYYPTIISVYARNNADEPWIKVNTYKDIKPDKSGVFYTPLIDLAQPYNYFRFDFEENTTSSYVSGFAIFQLGEFQLYPGTLDEAASVYTSDATFRTALDELQVQMVASRNALAQSTVSAESLNALQSALDRASVLSDSLVLLAEFTSYFNECKAINYVAGVAQGQCPAEFVDAFNTALTAAAAVIDNPGACTVDEIRQAYQALREAREQADENIVGEHLLKGQIITSGGQNPEYAFDGNVSTQFNTKVSSYGWIGLDLGEPYVITRVAYAPAFNYEPKMQLGIFEGANSPDFLDAVPLYIIKNTPEADEYTEGQVVCTRGFRYVRYVSPTEASCRLGDLRFYGVRGEGTDEQFALLSEVPVVTIHTENAQEITSKSYYLNGYISVISNEGAKIKSDTLLVRGRGNGSWTFPQKPYKLKLAHKAKLLGGPAKAKEWALVNNYRDKSLIRNMVGFELSRRIGMPYTPSCHMVDVILNGEYKGMYLLHDQVEVREKRLDITEMTPDDNEGENLTGGYFIELDANASSEPNHFSSRMFGTPVTVKYPKSDKITPAQNAYIRDYYNKFETTLFASDYKNPTIGYRSMLDLPTYLKRHLVSEFVANTDAAWSIFMTKDRGNDQFVTAPLWDLDLTFDNDSRTYPVCNMTDFLMLSSKSSTIAGMRQVLSRILTDATDDMSMLWTKARFEQGFNVDTLYAFIDSLVESCQGSQELHFKRWPILNTLVALNTGARGSHQAEVEWVKNFIPKRLAWMDSYVGITNFAVFDEYGFATVVLPTPVTKPSGVKAFYMSSYKDGFASLASHTASVLPINTPVLLMGTPGDTIKLRSTTGGLALGSRNKFKGSGTDNLEVGEGMAAYVYEYHNGHPALHKTDLKVIPKGTVYFVSTEDDAEWIPFSSNLIEGVHAVEVTPAEENETYYDLQGRPVTNPRHGIYIRNGRKVMVGK